MTEFLADLDQIFINCRIYNGSESIVGRIGTQVQTETEGMIRGLRLRERFGSSEEQKRFMIDAQNAVGQDIGTMNLSNAALDIQNTRNNSENEQSEDDIPKHQVPYHNNQVAPRFERTFIDSGRDHEAEPGEAHNQEIFEEE